MNDDFFFYQEDGQTMGPVSSDEVKERIRKGRIRLFDLILREGEASWRMALEHGEFKTEFKEKSKSALRERPWVCLQRKSPDGFDFITTGPFSEEEVREGLLAGRVSYSDYAWRSGYSEWRRIGLVEDFNPRLKREVKPPDPPPESAEELLKNVVEMKRPRAPLPELPPEDAATDDLTKGASPPPSPPPLPEIPEPPPPARLKRKRKTVPWLDWGIVGILIVVLGAVTLVLSRNIKRSRVLEVPETTVLETVPPPPPNAAVEYEPEEPPPAEAELEPEPPPPASEPEPTPAKEEPKPKKVSRAPTELYLSVQNRSKNQARVELRTNGTAEYPVYVQVVGVPGYVSTGPSFYRYLKLTPNGDLKKPLDLSKLKLPQGRLIFRAQTGDLKREAKLNVGTNDPQFKRSLGRVRKLHAYALWSERLELIRVADLLEKRLGAADGQKLNGKGLESLNAVSKAAGYKYALFDDWFELKSVYEDAKKQTSSGQVARVKKVREKMASFSIWK